MGVVIRLGVRTGGLAASAFGIGRIILIVVMMVTTSAAMVMMGVVMRVVIVMIMITARAIGLVHMMMTMRTEQPFHATPRRADRQGRRHGKTSFDIFKILAHFLDLLFLYVRLITQGQLIFPAFLINKEHRVDQGDQAMSTQTVEQAIEAVYEGLHGDDLRALDTAIAGLKEAMKASGAKEAVFSPERLAQKNREGRKRMQSYFKKRGVAVKFSA